MQGVMARRVLFPSIRFIPIEIDLQERGEGNGDLHQNVESVKMGCEPPLSTPVIVDSGHPRHRLVVQYLFNRTSG